MKVIITGATSFVGRASATSLRAHSHELTLLRHSFDEEADRLPDKADVWLHFAWAGRGSAGRSDAGIQQFNVEMTMAAVQKARELGCRKFVFAGSQAEYGHAQDGTLKKEYGDTKPVSEYGKAKLRVLQLAQRICVGHDDVLAADLSAAITAACVETAAGGDSDDGESRNSSSGLEYIHLRLFSVYGPGDHEGSLIDSLIRGFAQNEDISLGRCAQSWNYMYIDDAAEAIACICEKGRSGIYNIGTDDIRPLRAYVENVHTIVGGSGRAVFGTRQDNAEGPADLSPDITKLTGLGFKPCVGFDDGIRQICRLRQIIGSKDI